MSLTLTLKADLLWTQSHTILFPSWPAFESNEWLLRARLCSPCPFGQGPRTQTHRHQHKHTQPLDIVPYYEVSLPKLPLERQLANHQASMDPAPQGPSNRADVASVGQQQTLPGGTNAEKRTGTAQHVRLLGPHTHTLKNTHVHTSTSPYAPFVKIVLSCTQLRGGVGNLQSSL